MELSHRCVGSRLEGGRNCKVSRLRCAMFLGYVSLSGARPAFIKCNVSCNLTKTLWKIGTGVIHYWHPESMAVWGTGRRVLRLGERLRSHKSEIKPGVACRFALVPIQGTHRGMQSHMGDWSSCKFFLGLAMLNNIQIYYNGSIRGSELS